MLVLDLENLVFNNPNKEKACLDTHVHNLKEMEEANRLKIPDST
jgi:hypothetical protein